MEEMTKLILNVFWNRLNFEYLSCDKLYEDYFDFMNKTASFFKAIT